jgi:hypothetical protein
VIVSAAVRGNLIGLVTKAGAVKLTHAGEAAAALRAGRYKVSVKDSSATSGFTIQESGKQARTITALSFVGTRTATLQLAPGRWLVDDRAAQSGRGEDEQPCRGRARCDHSQREPRHARQGTTRLVELTPRPG